MRKLVLAALVMAALAVFAGPAAAQSGDLDCKDFNSQAEAQAKLEEDTSDPHRLDADNDGQACEAFDYGQAGGQPGGQAPPTTGPGTTEQGLPFTGPRESLLPLGGLLLAAGVGLLGVTRYRARHTAR
jgi:hypothetical protein